MAQSLSGSSLRARQAATIRAAGTTTLTSFRNRTVSRTAPGTSASRRSARAFAGTAPTKGPPVTGSVPLEGAAAPDVDQADEQHPDEAGHLDEPLHADLAEDRGRGIEERRLDVEQDEQHRHHVEADGVTLAGRLEQVEPALVRAQVGAAVR